MPGIGSPLTFGGTSQPALSPAPRVGQHSRTVLDDFGFSATEINDLLAAEVVWEG